MKDTKQVFILKNDYVPDAGSMIYGVYATRELAEKAEARYASDDNEFGEGCEELEIDQEDLISE